MVLAVIRWLLLSVWEIGNGGYRVDGNKQKHQSLCSDSVINIKWQKKSKACSAPSVLLMQSSYIYNMHVGTSRNGSFKIPLSLLVVAVEW